MKSFTRLSKQLSLILAALVLFASCSKYEILNTNSSYFKFSYKSPVRLKFLPRDPIVRIGYEFAFKDYSSITGEIGEERLDKRHTVTAELELPISDHVGLQVEFERIGARSNLESSDFAQRIYALSMLVSF